MIAKNSHPNERSITSILNSIANWSKLNPLTKTDPIIAVDLQKKSLDSHVEREPKDSSAVKLNSKDISSFRVESAASNDQELNSEMDHNEKSRSEFNPKNRIEAMELAQKLYASWKSYCSQNKVALNVHPFNALLKVVHCTRQPQLLSTLLPPTPPTPSIIPTPDVISYTTAMLICGSMSPPAGFHALCQYFEAMQKNQISIDQGAISAALIALEHQLRLKSMPEMIHFLLKLANMHMRDNGESRASTSNRLIRLLTIFGKKQQVLSLWNEKLEPSMRVGDGISYEKARRSGGIDEFTVVGVANCMTPPHAIDFFLKLIKQGGMHVSEMVYQRLCSLYGLVGKNQNELHKYQISQ